MKHKIATALMYILNLFPFSIILLVFIPFSDEQRFSMSVNAPYILLAYLGIIIGISIVNYFFFNSYQKVLSAECILSFSLLLVVMLSETDGNSISQSIKTMSIIATMVFDAFIIIIPTTLKYKSKEATITNYSESEAEEFAINENVLTTVTDNSESVAKEFVADKNFNAPVKYKLSKPAKIIIDITINLLPAVAVILFNIVYNYAFYALIPLYLGIAVVNYFITSKWYATLACEALLVLSSTLPYLIIEHNSLVFTTIFYQVIFVGIIISLLAVIMIIVKIFKNMLTRT